MKIYAEHVIRMLVVVPIDLARDACWSVQRVPAQERHTVVLAAGEPPTRVQSISIVYPQGGFEAQTVMAAPQHTREAYCRVFYFPTLVEILEAFWSGSPTATLTISAPSRDRTAKNAREHHVEKERAADGKKDVSYRKTVLHGEGFDGNFVLSRESSTLMPRSQSIVHVSRGRDVAVPPISLGCLNSTLIFVVLVFHGCIQGHPKSFVLFWARCWSHAFFQVYRFYQTPLIARTIVQCPRCVP